jgi:hypothetical protein
MSSVCRTISNFRNFDRHWTWPYANYCWHLLAFQFFLMNTATMLNRESMVSAVKHRYTNLGVAAKIVRSKDGEVWTGCDRGGSVKLATTYGNVFKTHCTTKPIHDIPLLNIGGITQFLIRSMRPLFFLSKECEEVYVGALRKNLLLMTWASFMNHWENAVQSPSNYIF